MALTSKSHWMSYAICEALDRDLLDRDLAISYVTALISRIVQDTSLQGSEAVDPDCLQNGSAYPVPCSDKKSPEIAKHFAPELIDAARRHATENLQLQLDYYATSVSLEGRG